VLRVSGISGATPVPETASVRIAAASLEDLPGVLALLEAAGLPLDGVASAFELGVVAWNDGRLVGAAAIERHGEAGILRSVVVHARLRGTGLGVALVTAAERAAAAHGIRELYLLTETAAGWFPRLGYRVIGRDAVPEAVAASVEWSSACPATAVAMRRDLA
jgi:amino-acid N-acetyltransferase